MAGVVIELSEGSHGTLTIRNHGPQYSRTTAAIVRQARGRPLRGGVCIMSSAAPSKAERRTMTPRRASTRPYPGWRLGLRCWPGLRRAARMTRRRSRHRASSSSASGSGRPGRHVGPVRPVPIARGLEQKPGRSCGAAAGALEGYKGTLGKSADGNVDGARRHQLRPARTIRARCVCLLKADEDVRVAVQPRSAASRLGEPANPISQKNPGWHPKDHSCALGAETGGQRFLAESAPLAQRFDFHLNDMLRAAPHTLGDQAEAVLAGAGTVLRQPATVRSLLAEGDMPLPTVTLSSGTKVRLDPAAYEKYRQSSNRADRKLVFDAFWGAWNHYQSTLGAVLTAGVMGDVFSARARNFATSLEAAQFADNMPVAVYRTLVDETNAALPSLHRYLRLRKRLLGITGPLHYYDNYPPLFDLQPRAAFQCRGLGAHHARGAAAARGGLSQPAAPGLCRALDERLSASGQGLGRLHGRRRLRRASLSAAQSQRRLHVDVHYCA